MAKQIQTSFAQLIAHMRDVPQRDVATVNYAFHVHRAGLMVRLRTDGSVDLVPFVNTRYDNRLAWCDDNGDLPRLKFLLGNGTLTESVEAYYRDKAKHDAKADKADQAGHSVSHGGPSHPAKRHATEYLADMSHPGFVADPRCWWLNGHILCNSVPQDLWSDRGNAELLSMLQRAWAAVPPEDRPEVDRVFVLNKRDAMMMHRGGFTPFVSLWDQAEHAQQAQAPACEYEGKRQPRAHALWQQTMTPPLSLYGGPRWHDVTFPLPEAWTFACHAAAAKVASPSMPRATCGSCAPSSACNVVVAAMGMTKEQHARAWAAKADRAVFRGTPTGPGSTALTNQRLALAALAAEHTGGPGSPDVLDVGLTAANQRDRVWGGIVSNQVTLAGKLVAACTRAPLTPTQQASRYKALIYADGHSAASRILWNLASGCCLLMIESPPAVTAPRTWLHDALVAGVHYVAVRADLSDLLEKVHWVMDNQAAAMEIAWAAVCLVKERLTVDAVVADAATALEAVLDHDYVAEWNLSLKNP